MTRVQKNLHFYLLLALSCLSSFPCHVVLEKVSSSYTQTLRQQDSPCRVWTFLQSFSTTMWFFFSLVSNSGNSWIFFSHFCHPLSDLHASWAFLRSSFFHPDWSCHLKNCRHRVGFFAFIAFFLLVLNDKVFFPSLLSHTFCFCTTYYYVLCMLFCGNSLKSIKFYCSWELFGVER